MKRTPLKRKTPMKRATKPMNKTSKSKRKELATRRSLTDELLKERGSKCQANIAGACQGLWTDKHEILSRGRGGSATDKDNILCVCRACHDIITNNTVWAEAQGFLRKAGIGETNAKNEVHK